MSDQHPLGDNDALLLLIRELSGGMQALRDSNAKTTEDVHRTRLDIAEIKATLQPVAEVVSKINDLSTRMALAESRVSELDAHDARISALEATASEGKGWQGFGGKLLYLVGGALVTAIIATGIALLVSKPAQASDVRLDPVAKCMAVPAKPRPKYLFV